MGSAVTADFSWNSSDTRPLDCLITVFHHRISPPFVTTVRRRHFVLFSVLFCRCFVSALRFHTFGPHVSLASPPRPFSYTIERSVLSPSDACIHSGRGVSAVCLTFFFLPILSNTDTTGGLLHSGRGVSLAGLDRMPHSPKSRTARHRGAHALPPVYTLDEGCPIQSPDRRTTRLVSVRERITLDRVQHSEH